MMEGEIVEVLAGFLDHLGCPAAVAPRDELELRIDLPHRLAELDRLANRPVFFEATGRVRGLISELPEADGKGFAKTVGNTFSVARIIAVIHPRRGFRCIAGAFLAE